MERSRNGDPRLMKILLATRGSALALWQANHVRDRIHSLDASITVELRIIRTTGDRITDVPLSHIGETGLFTKEVDNAVLSGEADAAIHSLKDVPTRPPNGLAITALFPREDPRDALLTRPDGPATIDELPTGARVGTSSLRRRALLMSRRTDLDIVDLRGNLDTRIGKLASGELDATILALAGLKRLGRTELVRAPLEPPEWLPAAGQGALAVVTRDDGAARALVAELDHAETRTTTTAERVLLRGLEGGCQIPIGALALLEAHVLTLHAFVAHPSGDQSLAGSISGPPGDPAGLATLLVADLLGRGAGEILARVRRDAGPGASIPAPPGP
jgi:hydroxymethylbilane synthase